jgi:hypothetical protein
MQCALERHRNGDVRVIPVILHPCDWQQTPFGKLRATPVDGKPVSKFPNQHDAFLSITKDIRAIVEENTGEIKCEAEEINQMSNSGSTVKSMPDLTSKPRSSNLRVRKEFTDIERSRFLSETLEYLSNFFENSLAELEARTVGIETELRKVDSNHFTATIYEKGKLVSQCKIWLAIETHSSGEIRYSSSLSSIDNSWNDSLYIDNDGYVLGLKTMGNLHMGYDTKSLLSKEGGAEYFWTIFLNPLQ